MSCLQASGIKHECMTSTSILFDDIGTFMIYKGAVKITDPLTEINSSNF